MVSECLHTILCVLQTWHVDFLIKVISATMVSECPHPILCVLQTWNVDFLEAWIKQHAADAAALGKPFMIEEFGKEVHLEKGVEANITSIRGPFYRKVYQQLQESLAADGPLKGALRLFVVPDITELKRTILQELHDANYSGHVGYQRTIHTVQRMYWWPSMSSEIREHVKGCLICLICLQRP